MASAIKRFSDGIVRKISMESLPRIIRRNKDEVVVQERSVAEDEEKDDSMKVSNSSPKTSRRAKTAPHESHDIYKDLQQSQKPATETTERPKRGRPQRYRQSRAEFEAEEKFAEEMITYTMLQWDTISVEVQQGTIMSYFLGDPAFVTTDAIHLRILGKMNLRQLRFVLRTLRDKTKEAMAENETLDPVAVKGRRRPRRGEQSWIRIPSDTGMEMRLLTNDQIEEIGGSELDRRIREGHEFLEKVVALTKEARGDRCSLGYESDAIM